MPRKKRGGTAQLERDSAILALDQPTDHSPSGRVFLEVTDYTAAAAAAPPGVSRYPSRVRESSQPAPHHPQHEFSMDLLFRSSPPASPACRPKEGCVHRPSALPQAVTGGARTADGRAASTAARKPSRDCWDSSDAEDAAHDVASSSTSSQAARSLPRAVPSECAAAPSVGQSGGRQGSAALGGLGGPAPSFASPSLAPARSAAGSLGGSGGGGGARAGRSGAGSGCHAEAGRGGAGVGVGAGRGPSLGPPPLCLELDRLLPRLLPDFLPASWPLPPACHDAQAGAERLLQAQRALSSLRAQGAHRADADADADAAGAAAGGAGLEQQLGQWAARLESFGSAVELYLRHQRAALLRLQADCARLQPGSQPAEDSAAGEAEALAEAAPGGSSPGLGLGSAAARQKLSGRSSMADFRTLRQIGSGGFGKVFEVERLADGSRWALKALCKRQLAAKRCALQDVAAEHAVLTQYAEAAHPFIVTLACAFQSERLLCLVMELLPGGQLLALLQREAFLPEAHAAFYLGEVALALEHLHAQGVVHRDLKPENVLLRADGHVCLTDFGLSKMGVTQRGEGASSFCGTVEYMAPEMLSESRLERQYGQAVDLWALGVLAFQLATGEVPWLAPNQKELLRKIRAAKLRFPAHTSAAARQLLRALLTVQPQERMQLPALKVHAFFGRICWADLLRKAHPPPYLPHADALERSQRALAPCAQGCAPPAGRGQGAARGGPQHLALPGAAQGQGLGAQGMGLSASPGSHTPLPAEFADALSALRFSYEGPTSAWLPLGRAAALQPERSGLDPIEQSPAAPAQLAAAAGDAVSPAVVGVRRTSLAQQLAALALGQGPPASFPQSPAGAQHEAQGEAAEQGTDCSGSAASARRPDDDAGLLPGGAKGAHARAAPAALRLKINVSCV